MHDSSDPRGAVSVFKTAPYWFIACKSKALKKKPVAARLWGQGIVLFRDEKGEPNALLDRCAHRNVPLSEGGCLNGRIQCPYHGWEFAGSGECERVPALRDFSTGQAHRVPSFAARESQGYVWVYTEADTSPHCDPYRFPHLDDSSYVHVHYHADFDASLHATAENILDVPHTAFLHKGLFRGGEPNRIRTEVRLFGDRVECEFFDEPRPSGLLGKILAPGGGDRMLHVDRFILPSVAQVEYKMGHRGHLVTTSSLSPLDSDKTRMYAVVSVKKTFWLQLLRPVITPIAMKVVAQDQEMLAKQTANIRAHGGEHYSYTPADTLGPGISRLLRRASKERVALMRPEELGDPIQKKEGELWA